MQKIFRFPFGFLLISLLLLAADTKGQTSLKKQPVKIGLVLSGGGAQGLAHIGVLKAFEEYQIPIDLIVGSSAGALVGGLYASGVSVEQLESMAKDGTIMELFLGRNKLSDIPVMQRNDKSYGKFSIRRSDSRINGPPGLLNDQLIWRGPILDKVLNDFIHDVNWGSLDYLIVDLPPGTGDVPLSLARAVPFTGVVLVTTPQAVAKADVVRCFALYQEINVPVLGLVENMSGLVCPHCRGEVELFVSGGGRDLNVGLGIPLLGQVPFDPEIGLCGDMGLPLVLARPESLQSRAFREIARNLADNVGVA